MVHVPALAAGNHSAPTHESKLFSLLFSSFWRNKQILKLIHEYLTASSPFFTKVMNVFSNLAGSMFSKDN